MPERSTSDSEHSEHLPTGVAASGDSTAGNCQTPPAMLQRLHERLLQSPSLINVQQIHRHYTQPQTTVARLMRRLDLPSHIESRYQSRESPTQGFSPRFNGQRTEVFGLGSEGMIQRVPSELRQRDADVVKVRDHPYGIPSDRADAHFPQALSPRSLTGEHSATPAFTPIPAVRAASSVIQAKASQPTAGVNRLSPISDATAALPSGLFRISRQPIASTHADTTARTVSPASPGNRQELPLSVVPQASEINAVPSQPSVTVFQPQIQAKTQVTATPMTSAVTIQQRARPAELLLCSVGNLDASVSQPPTTEAFQGVGRSENQGESASLAGVQPVESSLTPFQKGSDGLAVSQGQTALPVIKVPSTASSVQLKPLSFPLPIQTQSRAGEAGNSSRTILRYSMRSEQSRSADTLQGQTSSVSAPTSEARPLYTPLVSTSLIQRQEGSTALTETLPPADTGSTSVSAISPPAPPAANSAAIEVDVAQIAEQVSRIILRRMVVERERRGLSR
ncbi:MAG TPA: hypothetical protein V6C85_30020 [Allocoleopsis sp.]